MGPSQVSWFEKEPIRMVFVGRVGKPPVLCNPVRARRGDASALFPEGESDAHAPRPARTHAHHPPVCRMESVSPSMERRVKSRDDRHIHYPFGCPCVCVRVINVDRPWRRAQRC